MAKSQYKRGDVHPETGLLFWDISCGKERFLTIEKFDQYKSKFQSANKKRYEAKHDEILAQGRKFRRDNWGKVYQGKVAYNKANAEHVRQYKRRWAEKNRKVLSPEQKKANSQRQSNWVSKKSRVDPLFALRINLRKATCKAFGRFGYTKRSKTSEILGCSWECVKEHIENQFIDGMTWDNRDKWHIDHIIPLASAKDACELSKLCHYTNLQPMWASDNIKKGAKIL